MVGRVVSDVILWVWKSDLEVETSMTRAMVVRMWRRRVKRT